MTGYSKSSMAKFRNSKRLGRVLSTIIKKKQKSRGLGADDKRSASQGLLEDSDDIAGFDAVLGSTFGSSTDTFPVSVNDSASASGSSSAPVVTDNSSASDSTREGAADEGDDAFRPDIVPTYADVFNDAAEANGANADGSSFDVSDAVGMVPSPFSTDTRTTPRMHIRKHWLQNQEEEVTFPPDSSLATASANAVAVARTEEPFEIPGISPIKALKTAELAPGSSSEITTMETPTPTSSSHLSLSKSDQAARARAMFRARNSRLEAAPADTSKFDRRLGTPADTSNFDTAFEAEDAGAGWVADFDEISPTDVSPKESVPTKASPHLLTWEHALSSPNRTPSMQKNIDDDPDLDIFGSLSLDDGTEDLEDPGQHEGDESAESALGDSTGTPHASNQSPETEAIPLQQQRQRQRQRLSLQNAQARAQMEEQARQTSAAARIGTSPTPTFGTISTWGTYDTNDDYGTRATNVSGYTGYTGYTEPLSTVLCGEVGADLEESIRDLTRRLKASGLGAFQDLFMPKPEKVREDEERGEGMRRGGEADENHQIESAPAAEQSFSNVAPSDGVTSHLISTIGSGRRSQLRRAESGEVSELTKETWLMDREER